MMRHLFHAVVVLATLAVTVPAPAQRQKEIPHYSAEYGVSLLGRAIQMAQIDTPASKPYKLIVTFRYNEPLAPDNGKLTRIWLSPTRWYLHIETSDFQQTLVRLGDTLYDNRNSPYRPLAAFTLDDALAYASRARIPDSAAIGGRKLENVDATCAAAASGLLCIDNKYGRLLQFDTADGDSYLFTQTWRTLGNKSFPAELQYSRGGKLVTDIKLLEFAAPTAKDNALVKPGPSARKLPACDVPITPPILINPVFGLGDAPVRPGRALKPHEAVVYLEIATDGSVGNVFALAAADPQAGRAAQNWIKTWSYAPAKCGDKPVPFETVLQTMTPPPPP